MKTCCSLLVLTCLAAVGCATPNFLKTADDVAPLRGDRRDEALRQFEIHRDNAEYQAAMERWKSGDPFTCEAQLRGLVTRNPGHLQGRLALADLTMERGDLADAEAQLREILKIAPSDAQTHHSLGLLLQAQHQTAAAQQHLAKAAELAPENTLYQLCVQDEAGNSAPTAVATR